jgi:glycosyltransferase involved in cell wall biosynthesis
VLLLVGYYMPDLGYQENGWIKALIQFGARTKVVARPDCRSGFRRPFDRTEYRPGTWELDGYELQRMPVYCKIRSMVWPRGMRAVIRDFAPDVVVSFGVGQILPAAGVRYKKEFGYKLICIFGDNSLQRPRNSDTGKLTLKGKILETAFRFFKKPLYAKAIEIADTIGYNTDPATKDILRSCLSPSKQDLMNKMISLPLGYEDDAFYYSPELRAVKRHQLGFNDSDLVFIYASRIQPRRRVEYLLQSIKGIMHSSPNVKLMIVGFLGDQYETKVKDYISKSDLVDRVLCLPLVNRIELNALYNAADAGIWHFLPTITFVESLGTGLPIVIPDDPSFSPQTYPKECVEIFKLDDKRSLGAAIGNMLERLSTLPDRKTRAKLAEKREYKQIVSTAMKSVGITLKI